MSTITAHDLLAQMAEIRRMIRDAAEMAPQTGAPGPLPRNLAAYSDATAAIDEHAADIRAADDANAARVDALLAARRQS